MNAAQVKLLMRCTNVLTWELNRYGRRTTDDRRQTLNLSISIIKDQSVVIVGVGVYHKQYVCSHFCHFAILPFFLPFRHSRHSRNSTIPPFDHSAIPSSVPPFPPLVLLRLAEELHQQCDSAACMLASSISFSLQLTQ